MACLDRWLAASQHYTPSIPANCCIRATSFTGKRLLSAFSPVHFQSRYCFKKYQQYHSNKAYLFWYRIKNDDGVICIKHMTNLSYSPSCHAHAPTPSLSHTHIEAFQPSILCCNPHHSIKALHCQDEEERGKRISLFQSPF